MMRRLALPLLLCAATALAGCGYTVTGRSWSPEGIISSADDGDPVSQRTAGDMYYWGDGVPVSWPLAQFYWEQAAAQGDTIAEQRLDNWLNGRPIKVVSDGGAGRRMFAGDDSGADDSTGDEEML